MTQTGAAVKRPMRKSGEREGGCGCDGESPDGTLRVFGAPAGGACGEE